MRKSLVELLAKKSM